MNTKTVSDSGRIFKNPVLELLTKTHIAIPLVLFYGSGLAALLYSIIAQHTGIISSILVFMLGVLVFTLVEYLVHRNFYHIEKDTPKKARIQYIFHGVHHDHPRDKKRLALPPLMSVIIAVLLIGFFRLVLGEMGLPFGGGFLFGYASYLFVHYSIHVFNPPKNFLGVIWKHHNIHHFVDPNAAFGVSSPLWDHIFGTMPKDPKAPRQTA